MNIKAIAKWIVRHLRPWHKTSSGKKVKGVKVVGKWLLFLLPIFLVSCSTIAKRDNGETLSITGAGKAVWPDGASIEGSPLIKLPDFSPKVIP